MSLRAGWTDTGLWSCTHWEHGWCWSLACSEHWPQSSKTYDVNGPGSFACFGALYWRKWCALKWLFVYNYGFLQCPRKTDPLCIMQQNRADSTISPTVRTPHLLSTPPVEWIFCILCVTTSSSLLVYDLYTSLACQHRSGVWRCDDHCHVSVVCLSVCLQDVSKTCCQIRTKLCGR